MVAVESTMSPDFTTPVIIVAIMPIASAYQNTPIPFVASTLFPTLVPTVATTIPPLPVGSSIDINDWEIKVEKIILTPSLSAFNQTDKAKGEFVLVFMSVTNLGLSLSTFVSYGTVDIMDAKGLKFEEDSLATPLAQDQYNTDFGVDINPDSSNHVVSVFDITESSEYYLLVPGSLAPQNGISLLLDIPTDIGH